MSLYKDSAYWTCWRVCWTCSNHGRWLLERSTCASRCFLFHTTKIIGFLSVVQCNYVLLWAHICIHIAIPLWPIRKLFSRVTTKFHQFRIREVVKKQTFYGQADRKRWPPLLRSAFRDFFSVLLTLYYDVICSETDLTREKCNAIPPLIAAHDHLHEAGPLTTTKRAWKLQFWDPSQWEKNVYSVKESNFNE